MNAPNVTSDRCPQKPSVALVDFVLGHLKVIFTGGSRQMCEEASFTCERRVLRSTNLIFVTRGTIGWTIGDRQHQLKPGSLLLSPPGVTHSGESLSRQITLLSMHLSPTLPGGRDVLGLLKPPPVQMVPRPSMLAQYLISALDEYKRDDPLATRQAQQHHAGLITLEILRHNAINGLLAAPPFDPLVTRILDDLDRRIREPTTLSQIAERSGYSAQHLNRLFKRALGVTPMQHLTHLRMRHASQLLLSTNATVADITTRIALSDPYYFSRLFKQHTGQSPTQYRAGRDSHSLSAGSSGPLE